MKDLLPYILMAESAAHALRYTEGSKRTKSSIKPTKRKQITAKKKAAKRSRRRNK